MLERTDDLIPPCTCCASQLTTEFYLLMYCFCMHVHNYKLTDVETRGTRRGTIAVHDKKSLRCASIEINCVHLRSFRIEETWNSNEVGEQEAIKVPWERWMTLRLLQRRPGSLKWPKWRTRCRRKSRSQLSSCCKKQLQPKSVNRYWEHSSSFEIRHLFTVTNSMLSTAKRITPS